MGLASTGRSLTTHTRDAICGSTALLRLPPDLPARGPVYLEPKMVGSDRALPRQSLPRSGRHRGQPAQPSLAQRADARSASQTLGS